MSMMGTISARKLAFGGFRGYEDFEFAKFVTARFIHENCSCFRYEQIPFSKDMTQRDAWFGTNQFLLAQSCSGMALTCCLLNMKFQIKKFELLMNTAIKRFIP